MTDDIIRETFTLTASGYDLMGAGVMFGFGFTAGAGALVLLVFFADAASKQLGRLLTRRSARKCSKA